MSTKYLVTLISYRIIVLSTEKLLSSKRRHLATSTRSQCLSKKSAPMMGHVTGATKKLPAKGQLPRWTLSDGSTSQTRGQHVAYKSGLLIYTEQWRLPLLNQQGKSHLDSNQSRTSLKNMPRDTGLQLLAVGGPFSGCRNQGHLQHRASGPKSLW